MRVVDESLLDRERRRRSTAHELVDDLELFARWSQIGRVVLVGAVAYELVVSPDIDIEVFTHGTPQIRDTFRVLAELAEHPRVTKVRFTNALSSIDQGLYSQVRCHDDNGQEWKVDVWALDESHPGPLSSALIAPMREALDDDARLRILDLKESRAAGVCASCASIDIYRAVIDGGVVSPSELDAFLGPDYVPRLMPWSPATHP